MTIFTAPLRVSYYPFETRDSFLRRLIAANHLDPDLTRRAVYAYTQGLTHSARDEMANTHVELLGGLPPGIIAEAANHYVPYDQQPRCKQCRGITRSRWLCIQCAQGQIVEQVPHHRARYCLKHRRWTGPDVHPCLHARADHPDLVRAERTFRERALSYCPTNIQIITRIIDDWARHTQPTVIESRRDRIPTIKHLPDRLQLEILGYPEAVALMAMVRDGPWLRQLFAEAESYRDIEAFIDLRVADLIPEHHTHISVMLTRELRPAIARYFHYYGPYTHPDRFDTELPIWHHDLLLITDHGHMP